MKNILLLISCFLGSFLFAQKEEFKVAKHSMGFSYGSNYSSRLFMENNRFVSPNFFPSILEEKGAFGFNVGVGYLYQFHKNLALETGFLYNGYSIRVNNLEPLIFELADTIKTGDFNVKSSLRTFSLPIKLNAFIVNKNKWRLFVELGVINSFVFNSVSKPNVIFTGAGNESSNTERGTYKPEKLIYLLGCSGSFGLDYFPINQLMLRFEPNTQFFFLSNQDGPYKELPYSFGCNIGVFWRFGM